MPIYAHELELPYLTGRSPYPPPDPTVGGGLMADLSWMYPRGPIDLGDRVQRPPGGRLRAGDARLAMDPHAGARHRARLVLPRRRPDPRRGRRVRHDQAGVAAGRDGAAPGVPRPAHVLHERLGRRQTIGRGPGGAGAGDRGDRARAADGRARRSARGCTRWPATSTASPSRRTAVTSGTRRSPTPAGSSTSRPTTPIRCPGLLWGVGAGVAAGLAIGALLAPRKGHHHRA